MWWTINRWHTCKHLTEVGSMHAKAKQTGLTWRMRNAAASRDSVLGSGNSNGNEIPLRCSLGLDLHFYATLFNSNPTGARVRRFVGLAWALRCFCFNSARDKKRQQVSRRRPEHNFCLVFWRANSAGFIALGLGRDLANMRHWAGPNIGFMNPIQFHPISSLLELGPHSSVIRPAFSNANLPTSRDRRMGSDISDGWLMDHDLCMNHLPRRDSPHFVTTNCSEMGCTILSALHSFP